jgi:hypothetical protein
MLASHKWAMGRLFTKMEGNPVVITAPHPHISPTRAAPMKLMSVSTDAHATGVVPCPGPVWDKHACHPIEHKKSFGHPRRLLPPTQGEAELIVSDARLPHAVTRDMQEESEFWQMLTLNLYDLHTINRP